MDSVQQDVLTRSVPAGYQDVLSALAERKRARVGGDVQPAPAGRRGVFTHRQAGMPPQGSRVRRALDAQRHADVLRMEGPRVGEEGDRKSTRLNSSHVAI